MASNTNVEQPQGRLTLDLGGIMLSQTVPHTVLEQVIITTTEDKLTLRMNEHLNRLESKSTWAAPAGILTTLLIGSIPVEFKDAIGIPKDTWHAVALIAAFLTFLWLVSSLWKCYWSEPVGDIVQEIKKTAVTTDQRLPPAAS